MEPKACRACSFGVLREASRASSLSLRSIRTRRIYVVQNLLYVTSPCAQEEGLRVHATEVAPPQGIDEVTGHTGISLSQLFMTLCCLCIDVRRIKRRWTGKNEEVVVSCAPSPPDSGWLQRRLDLGTLLPACATLPSTSRPQRVSLAISKYFRCTTWDLHSHKLSCLVHVANSRRSRIRAAPTYGVAPPTNSHMGSIISPTNDKPT